MGVYGQESFDVVRELHKHNVEYCDISRADFDIINFAATHIFITKYMSDIIIYK